MTADLNITIVEYRDGPNASYHLSHRLKQRVIL